MKIAVSGASGLVGSALLPQLAAAGHQVTRLVRGEPKENEVRWDPRAESFDASGLNGTDAVVHLAGKGIASSRWRASVKKEIRDSRANGTRVLCEGLANMPTPPKVFVCASAIGIYGDRGDEVLTEESEPGAGFLADVAQAWEAATQPAAAAGMRVVNLRFGMILSGTDGPLVKMLLPFKLGVGGRIGGGRQYWSWVAIDDAVAAIEFALVTGAATGPVNVAAPDAVTNIEFTKTLGRVIHRPTFLPLPAFAVRVLLGEMANELLLASARVVPAKLTELGYEFQQPELEPALRHVLDR